MKKELNKKQLKKSTGGASRYAGAVKEIINEMHRSLDKMIKDGTIEENKHVAILTAYLSIIVIPVSPQAFIMPITYEDLEKEADRYIREKTNRFW